MVGSNPQGTSTSMTTWYVTLTTLEFIILGGKAGILKAWLSHFANSPFGIAAPINHVRNEISFISIVP